MMFRNNLSKILLAALLVLAECSDPEMDHKEGERRISMAHLKTYYAGVPVVIGEVLDIMGIVISSDEHRNFYKSIIVQDSTGAMEIKLNLEDSFLSFPTGSEIMIRCQGLTIGTYGQMLQLGKGSTPEFEVNYIPTAEIAAHISRVNVPLREVLPTPLKILDVEASHIGCFVSFDNVQFDEVELDHTWCENGMPTNRYLTDLHGNKQIVRTSEYAIYHNWFLPSGSGYIEGIMTYFNGNYQLKVIDARNNMMTKPRFDVVLPGEANRFHMAMI